MTIQDSEEKNDIEHSDVGYRADSDFVAMPDSPNTTWRSARDPHRFYGRAAGAIGVLLAFIGLAWIATNLIQGSNDFLSPLILIILGVILSLGGFLYFRRSERIR